MIFVNQLVQDVDLSYLYRTFLWRQKPAEFLSFKQLCTVFFYCNVLSTGSFLGEQQGSFTCFFGLPVKYQRKIFYCIFSLLI